MIAINRSYSQTERNYSYDDEARLLADLRAGDDAAYDWLVRAYSGRMTAVAARMLHDDADASDAVQDAFIAAFKAIDSFQGQSQIGTWLQRILINACLMKLRARKSRGHCSLDELLPSVDDAGRHVHGMRSSGRTPDAVLQTDELRSQVRRCIDRLPARYRAILLLRDIEELDTEQTAAALRLSPGAVKTRLHRARQALRTLLAPLVAT